MLPDNAKPSWEEQYQASAKICSHAYWYVNFTCTFQLLINAQQVAEGIWWFPQCVYACITFWPCEHTSAKICSHAYWYVNFTCTFQLLINAQQVAEGIWWFPQCVYACITFWPCEHHIELNIVCIFKLRRPGSISCASKAGMPSKINAVEISSTVETVICDPSRDLNEMVAYYRGSLNTDYIQWPRGKKCMPSKHFQNLMESLDILHALLSMYIYKHK